MGGRLDGKSCEIYQNGLFFVFVFFSFQKKTLKGKNQVVVLWSELCNPLVAILIVISTIRSPVDQVANACEFNMCVCVPWDRLSWFHAVGSKEQLL